MDSNYISRRGLIGAGAGLAASATVLGTARTASRAESRAVGDGAVVSLLPADRIGLGMFSVRNDVSSQGFDKVFAKLAEIGFKHIEFAGYTQGNAGAITVKQLRAVLDKHGLKAAGNHAGPSSDESMKQILDDAEALGMPYIGNAGVLPTGSPPGPTTDGWKAAAETTNHYGEMAAKRGMQYYVHNHFWEFAPCVDDPSKSGHDIFLAECDPRYVFLELDIFWAYVAAAQQNNRFDVLKDYILKHADRYKLFHVKDGVYDSRPAGTITDVGQGKIDYQAIFTELFKLSPSQPGKHIYLWENDDAGNHPRGSLAAAQSSYANLRYALKKAAAPVAGGAGGSGTGSGSTASSLECTTPEGLAAALNRIRFRRTKAGRQALAIGLRLSGPTEVSAQLRRGNKTLAKTSSRLGKGSPTLSLALPRRTAKGSAQLTVSVRNSSGTALTVRRTVQIPGGK